VRRVKLDISIDQTIWKTAFRKSHRRQVEKIGPIEERIWEQRDKATLLFLEKSAKFPTLRKVLAELRRNMEGFDYPALMQVLSRQYIADCKMAAQTTSSSKR
jgi:hypothetical protein